MELALSQHSGIQNCEVASRILVKMYICRMYLLAVHKDSLLYMGQDREIE
jgi:hypothetical protein